VLLAYVDESYNEVRFSLSALVVSDAQGMEIISGLDEVVARATLDGVPADAELHGAEMFHGNGDWKGLPPWLRVRVYREATDCIGRAQVGTFFSSVNLASLPSDVDGAPHETALGMLLESLHHHAESVDELVLIIANEIHTAERHRTRLRANRDSAGSGSRGHLDRIFDTLYFGPSRHSRLLQAADLLTYIYLRRATVTERGARASMANNRIWKPIAPTIVTEMMFPEP
jgi:hypothetical protein